MKRIWWVIAVCLCVFSIAGSSFAGEVPLRVAIKGEPSSLDPHRKKVIWDQFVAYTMFDTLTKYTKRMRRVSSLAVSWNNPDPLTWIVKIKQGVRFHNGDMLTTEDIIFSFDRIRDKYKGYSGLFSTISSYEALDDYTLRLKTDKPYDSVHQFNNIFILPKKYLLEVGDEEFARHPVGSGQYVYVSGGTKELRLKRNPDYWGKPAETENVVIKFVPRDQQFAALKNGEVDIVQDLLVNEFQALEQDERFNTYIGHSNNYNYLGMNLRNGRPPAIDQENNPLADSRVRLAIAKTVNMDSINEQVFGGMAFVATQLGNSGVFGYSSDIRRPAWAPAEAKALLKEAGYGNGFRVDLHTPLGARESVAKCIAAQLKTIGIIVTVKPVPDKLFWRELFQPEHSYSLFIGGFSVGQSVEHSLTNLFVTRNDSGMGRLNFFGYSNLEFDQLLITARDTTDTRKKSELLMRANQLVMGDRPVIPLYCMPQLYGLTKRVDWKPAFTSKIRVGDVKIVDEPDLLESITKYFW